jgi:flavin-binding protein dodecin
MNLSGGNEMVIKVVEVIGSSPKSWEDAAKNALEETAETVRDIKLIDANDFTAKVENNKIVQISCCGKNSLWC